ncbi:MAG: HzsA-related protein, partial [Planctomycetota bacterium]
IPGTDRVVISNSPGHGRREHEGHVAVCTPEHGPDDPRGMRNVTRGSNYRDPWAFSERAFMAARGKDILLLDDRGAESVVLSGRNTVHEPRPLVARRRERVVPSRVDVTKATGTLLIGDVRLGRGMEGVKPGEITKLLVLETLPKPINYTGGMDPMSYGGTFTLERIVGTVPVEPDGSAHFELPADRAFFFVALDKNDLSVKRMQSFLSVAPGETTSCVGCHESRTQAMSPIERISAARRAPSKVTPVAHVPDVIDFPRDVQPVLDRHCVRCHGYEKPAGGAPSKGPYAGGVILTGDRGPMFSHSYFTLTVRRQFVDDRNDPKSNLPPRTIGTSASPIMKKLSGGHNGVRLSPEETDIIRYWIESGAAYPGTYAALGSGMIGGYAQNRQVLTDRGWPEAKAAGDVIKSRCASCHKGNRRLPQNISDEIGISFWRMNIRDARLAHSRHRVWNLSRPEKSLMVLAPLAKPAGGFGRCTPKGGKPVFADDGDDAYRAILALAAAGKRKLEEITRFDMADFEPPRPYLREMHRYGVLPDSFDPATDRADVYELGRRYFESMWHYPPGAARPKLFDNARPYGGEAKASVPARALWP